MNVKATCLIEPGLRGWCLSFCSLALMMVGLGASATTLPVNEGFETYADNAVLNSSALTNLGWGASSSDVVVRTVTNVADAVRGTNALAIPAGLTASNVVALSDTSNVWSEVYVHTNMAMPADEPTATDVDTNQVAIVFLNTNGCPVVWDATGSGMWRVYTQDVWQTNVSTFATSAWSRLTLCQNYSNKTVSLFLNEHLMFTGLRFIDTNRTGYAEFAAVGGGNMTSYLDEVSTRYEPPTNNWTADLDNDGVADAAEIQANGNMTTIRRLTITAAQTNLTDGGTGGGWLAAPVVNPFEILWTNVSTNLHWNASNDFYAADLLTNGESVGNFTGRDTNYAEYAWLNTQADATVRVVFARMPVITASNSAFGEISPTSTNCYPGESRTFTFQVTNDHYFIAGVLTNGQSVSAGDFSGQGTNSGTYVWPAIMTNGGIEVQYAHKYTNSWTVVTVGGPLAGVGGTVSASPSEVYPGEAVTFTLTPNPVYGVTALTNNGALAATFGGSLTECSQDITNVQAHMDVIGVFTYTAQLRVPGDYGTITGAVAAALEGDTIIVSNGTYAGDVALTNMTLIATNTIISGGLSMTTGTLASCTGLTVDTTTVNGLLVVSNGSVNVGTLTIAAGATVQVVNATAFVANGATFTGTVTLAYGWDSTVIPQTPPCSDPFDRYAVGTKLKFMGYYGWETTSDGVVVQTNEAQSGHAVTVPASATLSHWMTNTPSAGASNVWSEVYVHTNMAMPADEPTVLDVDTSQVAMVFLNTNGCPVVWDATGSVWRVFTQDVWQTNVSTFATSAWSRLTLCQNYSNKTVALFLNEHLMFTGLRFIDTNRTCYTEFTAAGGADVTSYLDDVSFRCEPPTNNWTADLDNDGMPDALEIQLYGNMTLRHRPNLSVTQPAYGWIAPSNTFEVMPGSSTSFTFHADIAYAVSQVYTNGEPVGAFTGQNTRDASWNWTGIIPDGLSDGSVSAAVSYVARRYVPGDYATLDQAKADLLPDETLIVTGGATSGGLTFSNMTLIATNTTVVGGLTVTTGTFVNCTGLTSDSMIVNGVLVVSNGSVDVGILTIAAGATVQVVNATAFTANGVTLTGTRTLVDGWDATVAAQTPPYADSFDADRYEVGTKLLNLGVYGWDTASDGVVVETNQVQSGQAVILPVDASLISQMTATPASNIWVQCYLQDTNRVAPQDLAAYDLRTDIAVAMVIVTNGYLAVYEPSLPAWVVCSNDFYTVPMDELALDAWPKIAVNLNYKTGKAAVFLDGRLLLQQLSFRDASLKNSGQFEMVSGFGGASWLDEFNVWTNASSVTSLSRDGDDVPDAVEIDRYGDVSAYPRGSVFTIR